MECNENIVLAHVKAEDDKNVCLKKEKVLEKSFHETLK